jgi:hypothetical protein
MLSDERIKEIYSMSLQERLDLPVFDVRKFKGKPVNNRLVLYDNGPRIGVTECDDGSIIFGRTEKLGEDRTVDRYITLPYPIKLSDAVMVTFCVDSQGNILYKEDYQTGDEGFDTLADFLGGFESN